MVGFGTAFDPAGLCKSIRALVFDDLAITGIDASDCAVISYAGPCDHGPLRKFAVWYVADYIIVSIGRRVFYGVTTKRRLDGVGRVAPDNADFNFRVCYDDCSHGKPANRWVSGIFSSAILFKFGDAAVCGGGSDENKCLGW